MTNAKVFGCYLIGGDTLLAQCGEHLLKRGHRIAGVISDAPYIRTWASGHGLKILSASEDYSALLASDRFEYLFAITHLAMIPDRAVAAPTKMAINFHDGPLPAYAGLNAPMWALINGESEYGITWHAMSQGIDEGDVLLSHSVAVDENDTALTLNTKCFAAALDSFPELIEQLENDSVERRPQRLENRSYFGRSSKPAGAGLLDWNRASADLHRLVRGLDTGQYENRLASAKAHLGSNYCVVERASIVPGVAGAVPGELIGVTSDALTVQTADGGIRLERLRRLDGKALSIDDCIDGNGLTQGIVLPATDAAEADALQSACVKNESFWRRRLASAEAVALPYRLQSARSAADDDRGSVDIVVPAELSQLANAEYAAAGAFLLFLGRVLGSAAFSVAVSKTSGRVVPGATHPLVAEHGFLPVCFDPAASGRDCLVSSVSAITRTVARLPWLRDLVAREPSLRSNPLLAQDAVLPVVVVLREDDLDNPLVSELAIVVARDGRARLDYSRQAYSDESVASLARHFECALSSLTLRPDTSWTELSLVSAAERTRLVDEWNSTDAAYDAQVCLHHAFEAQAAKTPDAVAIADANDQITYAELNDRADRMAVRLQRMGVGTETLVGVHVPRSIDLMVTTLGVLKAGGAYVPLDPAFPADRLEFMIMDSRMPVIVSHTSIVRDLPAASAQVICVDDPA
ncbi:MAG TPA: AMP-binding protein, partial [Thermomicrobiales bacterium]|nr:AMP-binding protein [Thermomicrobiales bacterium]